MADSSQRDGRRSRTRGITERPLTARQVAERCGVELKTVHNWVAGDLLPHFRTPGRHLRFLEKDVERFLVAHGAGAARAKVLVMARSARWPRGWHRVDDPFEGLCLAGAEQPNAVVVDARTVAGLDARRFLGALGACVRGVRIIWVGPRLPARVGRTVSRASTAKEAIALLGDL